MRLKSAFVVRFLPLTDAPSASAFALTPALAPGSAAWATVSSATRGTAPMAHAASERFI
jgi:hypothetical protein